jgi:transcriptional regulator with XRE-family HTH domain
MRPSQTQEHSYTAAEDRFPQWDADRTRISNAERTERDAGKNRAAAAEWHDQTLRSLLARIVEQKSKLKLDVLLKELSSERGLSWSEIARLVGVSVPAIRKWRNGGDITPAKLSVALLVAFLQILEDSKVADPAAWLAVPVDGDDGSSEIVKSDIYVQGGTPGAVALLAFAKDRIRGDELVAYIPVDRHARSRNIVSLAPDGNLSITPALDR